MVTVVWSARLRRAAVRAGLGSFIHVKELWGAGEAITECVAANKPNSMLMARADDIIAVPQVPQVPQ